MQQIETCCNCQACNYLRLFAIGLQANLQTGLQTDLQTDLQIDRHSSVHPHYGCGVLVDFCGQIRSFLQSDLFSYKSDLICVLVPRMVRTDTDDDG